MSQWVTYEMSEISSGLLLSTNDFGAFGDHPREVHYTDLVGETDPEMRTAYQFFRWMVEDKSLNVFRYFDTFGVVDPMLDDRFGFIRRYSELEKTSHRIWVKKFLKMVQEALKMIDKHLEDLLPLRGLAVSREFDIGVPIRGLTSTEPQRIVQMIGWEDVTAAWTGKNLTHAKNNQTLYTQADAYCENCFGRLPSVAWFHAANWVAEHRRNCL